jgi:protein-tyrosine-phosphatase
MDLARRAAIHAALGDPMRLAIVDQLAVSDRSPAELAARHRLGSNLLAHHLDVLEAAGLILRSPSAGDGRRKYVALRLDVFDDAMVGTRPALRPVLFLCSHNSARSQLAAALWQARTGLPARSAGTHPAPAVHRGAVAAARRAGLDVSSQQPRKLGRVPAGTQVITVCDRAHEELEPDSDWWHWSIPDPVPVGTAAAFDAVVAELDRRIAAVASSPPHEGSPS